MTISPRLGGNPELQHIAPLLHGDVSSPVHRAGRLARPPAGDGTPPEAGTGRARAQELRDMGKHRNVLNAMAGKDSSLAQANYDLLNARLGSGFLHIMNGTGVVDLVKDVKLENHRQIQNRQDPEATARLARLATAPMPANIGRGEFGVCPLDVMLYDSPESKFGSTILEMNGSGYGDITTMEPNMLEMAMKAMGDVAHVLDETPNALFVIACSGREDPPAFPQSKKIHEKLMIAQAMNEAIKMRQVPGLLQEAMTKDGGASNPKPIGAQIVGLDSFDADALERDSTGQAIVERGIAKEKSGRDKDGIANLHKTLDDLGDWHAPKQPTIIVGYTGQLAQAIKIGADGAPYLNGRKVNVINNDRLIQNIEALGEKHGKKLDLGTFLASNVSYVPAASKSDAYAFANEYNARPEIAAKFPHCSRPIVNQTAHSIEELHEKVLALLEQGIRVIIKPRGTGHCDGVRAFDIPELADPAKILEEIRESLHEVDGKYAERGGLPYTVSEYLSARRINKPGHPMHTMKYELRLPVLADVTDPEKRFLKATHGGVIKIDASSKLKEGESGNFSKRFAGVSAQVLETGLPAEHFMLPLSDPETLELLDLTEEDVQPLLQWAVGYVEHVLTNIDRVGAVQDARPT